MIYENYKYFADFFKFIEKISEISFLFKKILNIILELQKKKKLK